MASNSRHRRPWIRRDRGLITASSWKALEYSLFLDQKHNLSRVEAYSAELLAKPEPSISVGEIPIQNHGYLPPHANGALDDALDADDFEITRLIALRSADEISTYFDNTNTFRAFFIRQKFSWSPLLVTADLFNQLTRQTHISPQFRSYIMYFGSREREVELSPPGLTFQTLSSDQGYDGRSHECMYVIRFAEPNGRGDTERPSSQWSLRQSAIHCRYCPDKEGASWLFITISQVMQKRLNSYVAENEDLSQSDPFDLHSLILGTAISSWRSYIIDLSAETDAHYAQLLGTSPSGEGPVDLHDSDRRQELMVLDEKLLNALLIVRTTMDTVARLDQSWKSTRRGVETQWAEDVLFFSDQERDLHLIITQLENLRRKLAGVSTLLSNFLDLSSSFLLQNLVKESGKETEEMRKLSERMHTLAEKSTQDAAAVKVLTILTLIYLPITVVSNFFSTSFVKSTTSPDGSGHISVFSDWWILLAVSLPLTLMTLYIWWVWTQIQADERRQSRWWRHFLCVSLLTRASTRNAQNGLSEKPTAWTGRNIEA